MNVGLEERVARLERENLILKRGVLAAISLLAAAVLTGQADPEKIPTVIRAHSFQAVDMDGKPRATLSAYGDDASSIRLARKDGVACIQLSVAADGTPYLSMDDKSGVQRLRLALSTEDTPSLQLFDKAGKPSPDGHSER